jgi:predicted MPP superfamily phosphohydrolase/uncharacterized protein (DUF924 family)
MRPICWIHISDIHMNNRDAWSQDVVLKAMGEQIERERAGVTSADFILATGDLAFSGKTEEYTLVAKYFDALVSASGVPKERIFCIPGNHDIDRDRQTLCFQGGRAWLQDQNRIDTLLGDRENLETLLKRQENYRAFQNSYFTGQDRTWTEDGLSYISRLTIDDVQLAILGLDSAWLAEGTMKDYGKLLIGERQVINAINLASSSDNPPHIILSMAHHPFHLLNEFDRSSVQYRVERACHFFHCGHLHEPEAHTVGCSGTGCLTLTAGASFNTRQFHNTFSIVTLNLTRGVRTVKTIQYNRSNGAFSFASTEESSIEVTSADTCSVSELAQAIETYHHSLTPCAHYLSALLLDQKTDLPIPAQSGHTFGSFGVLQNLPDCDLKHKTANFITFRNVLRVLYKRIPLLDILAQHGAVVRLYGDALMELSDSDSALKDRLTEQESDAQMLASTEPRKLFSFTGDLLLELADAQEWDLLREHAQRHVDSPDPTIVMQAKRMLALSFAHSFEAADKENSIKLYRTLVEDEAAEISDTGNLATLLIETGKFDEAKTVLLDGIGRFPAKADYFSELGQKIVEMTGDRKFRKKMETATAEKR